MQIDGVNQTVTTGINITDLRISKAYVLYLNWSRSFVLGIFPALLLIYFNTKIYLDIKERERRRRPKNLVAGGQNRAVKTSNEPVVPNQSLTVPKREGNEESIHRLLEVYKDWLLQLSTQQLM